MNDLPKRITGAGIQSILRNAAFLLGGRFLNTAVRFVYVLLLTRYLSPERYGLLNFGMAWYLAFLSLTDFGLEVILSRGVGEDNQSSQKIVSKTFGIRIAACIAVALLCGAAAWMVEPQPEIRQLLYIFSVALIGRSLSIWNDGVFIAHEKAIYSLKMHAWFRPLEVVLGIIAMLSGGDILSLAVIQALSWWLQAMIGIGLFKQLHIGIDRLGLFKVIIPMLRQGTPVMIGSIFATWMLQGPLVMFRHLCEDNYSLGQFALSMQIFMVASHMPMAVNSAALPVLSRSVARKDGKDIVYLDTMLRLTIVLGTLIVIGAFSMGPWIVEIVFGSHYQPVGRLMGPVLMLLVPWSIGGSIARTYYARGRFTVPAICAGIGAAVLVMCMLALVDEMGALGAVISAGAGMGVWAICILIWFIRSDGLDVKQAIIKPITISLLAGIVYMLLVPFSGWVALASGWLVLVSGALVSGVVSKGERLEIRQFLGFAKK